MTSPIKDTVRVSITNDTLRLAERGFGTTLIIGQVNHLTDRTKLYTDPAELLADGYSSTGEIYLKSLALMGQARTPVSFMIGRKVANSNAKQQITLSATPTGGTFTLILGTEETSAISYDADAAAIKAALEALTAITEVTVTRASLTSIVIEFTGADAAKAFATIECDDAYFTPSITAAVTVLQYGSAVETIAECYQAIKDSNDSFYVTLLTTDISDADALSLAAVIETETRFLLKMSFDATVTAATYNETTPADFPSNVKKLGYHKTATVYSDTAANYIDAGIVGLQLTKVPGSSTFMYKNLTGVAPATLTTQQRANLRSKNCNFYETQGGRAIFKDGVCASGEWIDIVMGIAYLTTRMSEVVYGGLSVLEKVDYDGDGLSIVESLMVTALINYGVNNKFISQESIVITLPDLSTVPAADKANRILKNVKFKATLKGAIHIVEIDGSLSV